MDDQNIPVPTGPMKTNMVEPATKTFFFERHDGSVIPVQEYEAFVLLKGGNKVLGPYQIPPKLIGVSDGTKFQQAVSEAHALVREGRQEEARARLKQGEAEEFEAAKGNIERPRNYDTIDRNGRPVRIQDLR